MSGKIGICAVAQTQFERDKWFQRFQGMAWEVVEQVVQKTGLKFGEGGIEGVITCSDDTFDSRTISNNAMTDSVGAHYLGEEKVDQDGAQTLYYAMANILSGHHEVMLIAGHCKESQASSREEVTHVAFDPFFTRPVGLDFLNAAGLQARQYMKKSNVTDEQLAKVVVRARTLAKNNPYTPSVDLVTEDDVLGSPMLCDPIRELHAYPVSDGAVALIVASEERARQICDNPIWVTGAGNCYDKFFFGERDLAGAFPLSTAAQRAYKMAGITNPRDAFSVVEVSDQYAYQQSLWMEGLGLIDEGQGGAWLADGGNEAMNVNCSGGMLAGNPLILGGLARVADAVLQLSGQAGACQVDGANAAVVQGLTGPAGQLQTVLVLES